jgi:hypothetical protein
MKFLNVLTIIGLLSWQHLTVTEILAAGKSVQGTVSVSSKLKNEASKDEVLFIIARPYGSPTAPPIAVTRVVAPKFPQAFTLNSDHLMSDAPFRGPFLLSAKLSKKGDASTSPGDLLGKSAAQISEGAENVKIVLKDVAP